MIRAFADAVLQLKDPAIMRLVMRCVALTLAVYLALFVGLGVVLRTTAVAELPWVDTLADLGAGAAAALLAWLLFPGVVSGLLGVFLDEVAAAVEARHYAHLGPPRAVPMAEQLGAAARLIGLTVGLNLLLLPLYVVLLFLPPLNLALFYAVNGRLLAREYFDAVALRRCDAAQAAALRQRHRGRLWTAGAITAALLTVPLLNLVAPVIGAAAMVHVFHKLTGRS